MRGLGRHAWRRGGSYRILTKRSLSRHNPRHLTSYNRSNTVRTLFHGDSYMRFIRLHPAPLVVVAALLSPPVVAGVAAQPAAPSHKHYDEPKDAPAPAPGAPLAPRLQNLGVHTFPVSTNVARAQQFINQGLNLTYWFNHAEAAR